MPSPFNPSVESPKEKQKQQQERKSLKKDDTHFVGIVERKGTPLATDDRRRAFHTPDYVDPTTGIRYVGIRYAIPGNSRVPAHWKPGSLVLDLDYGLYVSVPWSYLHNPQFRPNRHPVALNDDGWQYLTYKPVLRLLDGCWVYRIGEQKAGRK